MIEFGARIKRIEQQRRNCYGTYEDDEEAFELLQKYANQQHQLLASPFNIENPSGCQDKIPLKETTVYSDFVVFPK